MHDVNNAGDGLKALWLGGIMEQITISSFFLSRLVQTTHLTAANSNEAGLNALLAYRTQLRRHRGQDLEVALMALAAARQTGHSVVELADWIRRFCERVLRNPDAKTDVSALLDQTPIDDEPNSQLQWYEQALKLAQSYSRP